MAVVASKLAVAKHLPSGDQLQARIVRLWVSSSTALHTHPGGMACWVQIRTVLSPLQLASIVPARWGVLTSVQKLLTPPQGAPSM